VRSYPGSGRTVARGMNQSRIKRPTPSFTAQQRSQRRLVRGENVPCVINPVLYQQPAP